MSLALPQDNLALPTGRPSQSWQRFFQNLASRVGDVTEYSLGSDPAAGGISPSSGAFVAAGATARYQKINGWVYWQVVVNVTDNGTGAGSITIPMPVPSFASVVGSGRNLNTSKMLQCTGFLPRPTGQRGVSVAVYNYDGTYPMGTSGILELQMIYEVT